MNETAKLGLSALAKITRRRNALALAALAAAVLFLPVTALDRVRVQSASLWWLLFLGAACWWTADVLANGWKMIVVFVTAKVQHRTLVRNLRGLTPDERLHLLHFFERQTSTGLFDVRSGVINGLEAKGIVFRASNMGADGFRFAYNIQPWARSYLSTHPALIKVTPGHLPSQRPN